MSLAMYAASIAELYSSLADIAANVDYIQDELPACDLQTRSGRILAKHAKNLKVPSTTCERKFGTLKISSECILANRPSIQTLGIRTRKLPCASSGIGC